MCTTLNLSCSVNDTNCAIKQVLSDAYGPMTLLHTVIATLFITALYSITNKA